LLLSSASSLSQPVRPTRVAVLDLGGTPTAVHAAAQIRAALRSPSTPAIVAMRPEFDIVDSDQAQAAVRGVRFNGSLNLTLQEARDLGAAIGCDFYFLGEAQTTRRSPSTGTNFYESYASIFLVSARTGRLTLWERPSFERATPEESEKALLAALASDETRHRYMIAIRRAEQDERAERARAVEIATPVIDIMSDDNEDSKDIRAPRPYRRVKPLYPETAARAEVEATVDVLADIDAQGEVGRVEVARWAGYGLDQSVVDTVRQLHFFPAMHDGVAIPMRVLLRYNFRKPVQNRSR